MAVANSRLAGITRFGQVNFTEADVRDADVGFWQDVWRRAGIEAVLLNCGGCMAYHPTRLAGHPMAAGVDERDLFGEMVAAAGDLGLEVIGRLDVGVVDQRFRDLHPQWMMTDRVGASRTLNDVTGGTWGQEGGYRIENEMYYTCINSALFDEYLPQLLAEVVESYDVAGFFTNGFPTIALAAPSTRMACWCERCRTTWRESTGWEQFPAHDDPSDPVFRAYVGWLRSCALDRLRALGAHTKSLSADLSIITSAIPNPGGGLPWNAWVDELDVLFCDNQDRARDYGRAAPAHGLWEVGFSSELLGSVAQGKPAVRIHSTARLRHGGRHTAKDSAELRLQMGMALAHGELPMWHAVGARQHDRSWIPTAVDFDVWLAGIAPSIQDRASLADVGIVWSQASSWVEAWGRGLPGPSFSDTLAGWHLALARNRIPAQLVLADGPNSIGPLRTLILPSGLALSDQMLERINAHIEGGGAVVVEGTAGMLDAWGARRDADPVGALVGVDRSLDGDGPERVSYLRLDETPFLDDLDLAAARDLIPGGNWRTAFEVRADSGAMASTGLPWIPSEHLIPTHAAGLPGDGPPTVAWRSDNARHAYLGVDLAARYFLHRIGHHRDLLGGLVRWTLRPDGPRVTVASDSIVDVRTWRVDDDVVVMLVNLDNAAAIDEAVEVTRPIGPVVIRVRDVGPDAQPTSSRETELAWRRPRADVVEFELAELADVELVRISACGATPS